MTFIHTKDLEQAKLLVVKNRDLSVNLCECVQNAIPSFTTSFFLLDHGLNYYYYSIPMMYLLM
jgi:hypothetical protein